MTYTTKRNIVLVLAFSTLLLLIAFALNEMSHSIADNKNIFKADVILKLAPTYILLMISMSKSVYDMIDYLFPIPKFKLTLNQKNGTYDIDGTITITNNTNKQLELLNIQNKFYNTVVFKGIFIEPKEIKHISKYFKVHNDHTEISKRRQLVYKIVYKINDSNKTKTVSIKLKNIFK